MSFRLQHLGYIFQDYALVPELSAEENVMLPLMMLGYEEPEAQMIARRTLDKFGLEGKVHKSTKSTFWWSTTCVDSAQLRRDRGLVC